MMPPLLQFLIGSVWAILVAFGGLWFAGVLDRPRKKPPQVAAE